MVTEGSPIYGHHIKTPIQAIPPEAVDLGAFAPLSGRAARGAAQGTWSSVEVAAFVSMDWFKGKSTGNHRFSH
jgi:hypothetical protein